jgi:hypothetical protein
MRHSALPAHDPARRLNLFNNEFVRLEPPDHCSAIRDFLDCAAVPSIAFPEGRNVISIQAGGDLLPPDAIRQFTKNSDYDEDALRERNPILLFGFRVELQPQPMRATGRHLFERDLSPLLFPGFALPVPLHRRLVEAPRHTGERYDELRPIGRFEDCGHRDHPCALSLALARRASAG